MKAAVFSRYGGNDVVQVKDMPMPICAPGSVLIRVRAAGVNPVDWKVRSGQAKIITGSRFPKILGNECAGEIVETVGRVKKFSQGDEAIGWPGIRRLGAFAEFSCVPEAATFPKPKDLSYEQAACIPIAGVTALQALRDKGQVAYGKKVLIIGASGGVGHFAVQIAKIFGAEVTAVCSGAGIDFVQSLGADRVLDYKREDYLNGAGRYDLIFDAAAKRTLGEAQKCLTPYGVYVTTLPSAAVLLNQYLTAFFSKQKAATLMVRPNAKDVQWIAGQIQAGRIRVIIEARYTLNQAKEALAASEAGRSKGKIVITV